MSKVVSLAREHARPIHWSDERSSVAAKLDWHREVICDAALNASARTVAGYLLHAFRGGVGVDAGDAWPSMQTMADDLGASVDTIKRAVRDLANRGWLITRRKSRTSPNTYRPSRNNVIAVAGEKRRESLRISRQEARIERVVSRTSGRGPETVGDIISRLREGIHATSESASMPSRDRAPMPS